MHSAKPTHLPLSVVLQMNRKPAVSRGSLPWQRLLCAMRPPLFVALVAIGVVRLAVADNPSAPANPVADTTVEQRSPVVGALHPHLPSGSDHRRSMSGRRWNGNLPDISNREAGWVNSENVVTLSRHQVRRRTNKQGSPADILSLLEIEADGLKADMTCSTSVTSATSRR